MKPREYYQIYIIYTLQHHKFIYQLTHILDISSLVVGESVAAVNVYLQYTFCTSLRVNISLNKTVQLWSLCGVLLLKRVYTVGLLIVTAYMVYIIFAPGS